MDLETFVSFIKHIKSKTLYKEEKQKTSEANTKRYTNILLLNLYKKKVRNKCNVKQ
jgi:hypothetical protein